MRMRRYVIGVVVWIAVAGVASAATSQWSVVPPAGWKDVTATVSQTAEVRTLRQKASAEGGGMELGIYDNAEGDSFTVVFNRLALTTRILAPGASVGTAVRAYEAGMHGSMVKKLGADTSYTVLEDDNMVVADEVTVDPKGTTRVRRLSGMNGTHLMGVLGICHGPEAVCVTALQSLALDRTGLRPLAASDVDPYYAGGQAAGRNLMGVALVVLIVGWLLSRRTKKPREREHMMIESNEDGQRLRALATTYKRMVLLVGLELLLILTSNGQRNVPVTRGVDSAFAMGENAAIALASLGVLVIGCVLVVIGYRLARILGLGVPIVWAIGMLVPLINLIVLLALSSKSQAVCHSHGVRVGLFGPNLDDVARLEQPVRAAGS